MQNTSFSLIPDLDNCLSDSRRKPVLKKCFDRVSQNVAVESSFARLRGVYILQRINLAVNLWLHNFFFCITEAKLIR